MIVSKSTVYDWRLIESLYDEFFNTGGLDTDLQDRLLIETAPFIRHMLKYKWKFLSGAYREDLFQVGLIEAYEVFLNTEIVPLSRRSDPTVRYSAMSYLWRRISRAMHKWISPQFDDIIVGMTGYHKVGDDVRWHTSDTSDLVSDFKESDLLAKINYKQSIMNWKRSVESLREMFRTSGDLQAAAEFVLDFRIFWGYIPETELLELMWSKYIDFNWVVDYVELRWNINKVQMEEAGTWIPETWRTN